MQTKRCSAHGQSQSSGRSVCLLRVLLPGSQYSPRNYDGYGRQDGSAEEPSAAYIDPITYSFSRNKEGLELPSGSGIQVRHKPHNSAAVAALACSTFHTLQHSKPTETRDTGRNKHIHTRECCSSGPMLIDHAPRQHPWPCHAILPTPTTPGCVTQASYFSDVRNKYGALYQL